VADTLPRCLDKLVRAPYRVDIRNHLAYRRAGSPGSPHKLLLLHGIGSSSLAFRAQLADLGSDFDVVAWDAPGYGASEDPPADFTLHDFADAAARVLDGLAWPSAHVLGHSFGGVVAQMLYHRHPRRVRSLILSDTNAGSGALPEPERSARVQRRLNDLATLTPRQMAERRAPNLVPPDAPAELVQDLIDIMAQIRPAGYASAATVMGSADVRPCLRAIGVPTLVLQGELDTIIPLSTAEELVRAIPAARLVVIPGAGHASNQHKPEAYNAAVRQFLQAIR
jgi:3-oxoadipate enol-lactonase